MSLAPARLLRRLPVLAGFLVLAGCDMSLGHLTGRANDEWTRTYPLSAGGEVHIGNTNGRIEIEGVDGSTVEVRAERLARAATDAAARELLPRIVIKEDAKPDRVSIVTERMSGIMIGASFEVRYHVRAPKNAIVDVSNTNGQVIVQQLAGKVTARTTNGGIRGRELTGTVRAHTTNGGVNVELSPAGAEKIDLETTNGGVTLYVPQNAKADISASWTNGGFRLSEDLRLDVSERSKRRIEGRMNGGGTPIELHTTNGGIRVRNRTELTEEAERTDENVETLKTLKGPKPPAPPKPPER